MSGGQATNAFSMTPALRKGQPFNPYRMFTGIFVPEGLARCTLVSAGAKLAWGRLTRYAGTDGQCYPTMKTLGEEIGVGERQAQKYVGELERQHLIRRVNRFSGRAQTSNAFEFLWHEILEQGVNDRSPEGVNYRSGEGVNYRSPKESQIEESHSEERDLDYPPTNRKKRDSRADVNGTHASQKQYPELREALAEYMREEDGERIDPSDRIVVDVMDAAAGANEPDVIRCLHYLREERGLKPGTKNGPRRFSWFKTVVADYFQQRANRAMVFSQPEIADHLSRAEFDAMTSAIETQAATRSVEGR